MLRRIYLSPFGRLISIVMNAAAFMHKPFMAYGYVDKVSGEFRKRTRVSSNSVITDRGKVSVGDNVWIGHGCVVDGSSGVTLGEGVQLASSSMVLSHGSQDAIRLLGQRYITVSADARSGYTREPVVVGEYTFLGAGSIVLAGTRLGKGCLVAAGSLVKGQFPDFSVISGAPAKVVGDVRSRDMEFLNDPIVQQNYFDPETVARFLDGSLLDTMASDSRMA